MSTLVTLGKGSASSAEKTQSRALAFEQRSEGIRRLIWLYIILWLIEGGLRRWVLPGLSTPLLIIRDPLVLVIYYLSVSKGLFPVNGFVIGGAFLALLSCVNALVLGHGNLLVALYGLRCDFLHVPLIFIMAKVLRQKDIIALSKAAVWLAVPYTALLVAQFYQPQDAWVNRGIGGDLEGAGFTAALDRYRPPGTFTFISGPSQLYPMITACWFAVLMARKLPLWAMIASGGAILVTVPISISRALFLSVAIVAIAGVGTMLAARRFTIKLVVQFALIAVVLAWVAGQSLIFKDGMEAFSARWEAATTEQGGFKEAIVDRLLHDLFGSLEGINHFGLGTGFSTNVGQKLLTGQPGFGASEAEWGRLLYDNSLFLGSLIIGYRIALVCSILFACLRAWHRRSPVGLIFFSASFLYLLTGQWGQTTTLGSAIIGGGLALAAAQHKEEDWRTSPLT